MSLGENLLFLRKKNDITQEQLAEKLDVSRQSISKWESDSTYPEMDKLLQLCRLFHVSMDDFVQKDVNALYVEDKAKYNDHFNLFSKMIALGVGFLIFGFSITAFLYGTTIGINEKMNIHDELCSIPFFIFLIISIAIFIVMGLQDDNFQKKNPYIENFYNAEEIDCFHKKYSYMITTGIVLIIIAFMIISILSSLSFNIDSDFIDDFDSILGSVFLFFLAIAVTVFVYAGLQKDKYDIEYYNKIHDKGSDTYKRKKLKGSICGCLMLIATLIYLIFGFVLNGWGVPYIVVFPVSGILCAVVSVMINIKYPDNK